MYENGKVSNDVCCTEAEEVRCHFGARLPQPSRPWGERTNETPKRQQ